jgi:ureidoacrylate peracid hydrolase
VLAAARRAGMRVVYTIMDFEGPGFPEELWNDARRARWIADVGSDTRAAHAPGLPAGATDTDILAELAPQPDDAIVVKPRQSGFFNTNLHAVLQDLGVTTLVFTGGTTSVCLGLTLTDAYFRDYRCLLLSDCAAELIGSHFARTNHDATLWLVEVVFGWVSDSDALVQALAAEPAREVAASAP